MRIQYSERWPQGDRDALDAMFVKARKEGLWFYHGGLSGPLWFSPDELQAQQEGGKFIWSAVNWKLRNPKEHLQEADRAVEAAQAERNRIAAKLADAGVPWP